jgi:Ca2+-binding EF-hand superfamily protein
MEEYVKRSKDPHVIRIKEKVQQYLIKYDYSLEHLFSFIDKDKSQTVTIAEFTRGLQEVLSDSECRTLFDSIDWDHNQMLTYEELVNGCSKIYASYVLHKMR